MTGNWWKRLVIGLAIAVVALIMIPRFPGNGQFYQPVIVPGVLLGAVLALSPGSGMFGRTAAFLIGGAVGTLMYLLRGVIFPQVPLGIAMSVALGVIILTVVWMASTGYWPLTGSLLGYGLVVAAYEGRFGIQPSLVTADIPAFVFPALATASVTFIVTMILVLIFGEDRLKLPIELEAEQANTPPPSGAATAPATDQTVSMSPAQGG